MRCLALLPDGLRFASASDDKTARIVEHGLAFAPTPVYVAARKESLKAQLKEEDRRHAEEVKRLKEEMVQVEAMLRSL